MFKPAARSQAKLKMAITGPSGSGKTMGALKIAAGLVPGGKFAVADTENGSASLYAGLTPFDTAPIRAPYTTEKYIELIRFAEANGYDVLVIDSLTHAWAGEGGLLQQKEQLDQRGGNSYTNWARITPKHEAFLSAILNSNLHIIATMRSKQDYVLQENSKGKSAPVKVGLAPVQRDGMEYEFTTVLDVAMNHEAVASKDRTGLFGDKMFKITEEDGKRLAAWLLSGAPADQNSPEEFTAEDGVEADIAFQKAELRKLLVAAAKDAKWTNAQVSEYIELLYGVKSSAELETFEIEMLTGLISTNTAVDAIAKAKAIKDAPVVTP